MVAYSLLKMSRPLETYRRESTKPPVSPFGNSHHSSMDLCKKGEVEMGGIGGPAGKPCMYLSPSLGVPWYGDAILW